jgi:hypothetical protein
MKHIVLGLALLASTSPLVAASYTKADFSGGVYGGNANVKDPFLAPDFFQGMPISGSFVMQDDLIPVGQGFYNVAFSSFADIGSIPAADAFSITIGSLNFNLSNDPSALVQFNNAGTVIGFVVNADFAFAGDTYRLIAQGSTWTVNEVIGGVPELGKNYLSGYFNQGRTNTAVYNVPVVVAPGVPEPATWAMMIGGLGLVGASLRRRATAVSFA